MTYYILTFVATIFISLGIQNNNKTSYFEPCEIMSKIDSFGLNGITFEQDVLPANKKTAKKMKSIQANVQRINAIPNWTSIDKKDLSETSQGGTAEFYTKNGKLEKITVRHYGENAQSLTEYYLSKGQLSFAYEKLYLYNRPIFYDSTAMIENEDTEVFDFNKSEIMDSRSYFDNGKLLSQKNIKNNIAPDSELWGKEEQRIRTNFKSLIDIGAGK